MAEQITDKLIYPGGYIDEIMSVESFDKLTELSRGDKFVGLTVTVTNALNSLDSKPVPVDVWLSESKSGWVVKNIPPVDNLDVLSNIPPSYIPKGFKILLKNGETYSFLGVDADGMAEWLRDVDREEFETTVSDAVDMAIGNITSGASEAFDTLKEIEDWIKNNGGNISSGNTPDLSDLYASAHTHENKEVLDEITVEKVNAWDSIEDNVKTWVGEQGFITNIPDTSHLATKEELSLLENKIPSLDGVATEEWVNNQGFIKEHQDISHLATSADVVSIIDEVKESIPSIDGLATEVYVQNAIAEAKLSGNTDIDLSGYATKDDIKDLASKNDIKTYTEGTSIKIDESNKISVKIAADTKEKENFIEVNEDNELVLNTITLDAAVISEDIEVNGGAWADEVETVFNGKIPAGITFEQFLKKMLKKEKFASNFSTEREFSVNLSDINPGITALDKNVNGETVEIGTKVVIGAINPTVTKATQSLSAGTFTYGYKIGENGTLVNSQVYTEKITPVLVQTASTLQVLFTNLTSDIEGTTALENIFKVKENEEDVIAIEPITAYVNKGYNSVTICQTGDTYEANTTVVGNKLYAATSLGNFYTSDDVTPNIYEVTFPKSEITATTQITYQVTGANKYFIGGISEYSNDYWNSNRSEEVRKLEQQGWATGNTIEIPYTFKEGTKQQTVVVPFEYTKVFGRDRLSGPVEFKLVKESMNFYNSQGYVSKYNVFVAPVVDGLSVESFINITISKN